MEVIRYEIQKGDTLKSIAEKNNILIEELVDFHNKNSGATNFIIGTNLPIYLQYLFLEVKDEDSQKSVEVEKEKGKGDSWLKTRFRCEQVNISKVDGNMVHFVEQKFQYSLRQSFNEKKGKVKLEEHLYNFNPPILNLSFDFISRTEFIKNDVVFSFSKENGRVEKILNKPEINLVWKEYRDSEFEKNEFIQRLRQTNTKAVDELKKLGNKQFSPDYELAEEEYRRNLFYFCCFDKFLVEDIENIKPEDFPFMSTIVPPIVVPVEFRYDKISEENGILKLRKVGTLKLTPELISEIEKKYDEIHKPNIKYGFTEYKLEFRVRLEFNTEQKIIETADVFIMEQIADNIDNTCEFHLKRLHNYES